MSSEKVILDYIESKIALVDGAPKASRHFYDLNKNDTAKDSFVYALRPGSTSSATGTVWNYTLDQEFELEISCDFVEKGSSNDLYIREAVEKIDAFMDQLYPKFTHRITPIILVKPFTKGDPEVDQNKKTVKRTYSVEITYRISLKGAP